MDTAVFTSPTATSDFSPAAASITSIAPAQQGMTQEHEDEEEVLEDGKKRHPKAAKRRKVNHACLYCRRSHMTCDEGRPCQRW